MTIVNQIAVIVILGVGLSVAEGMIMCGIGRMADAHLSEGTADEGIKYQTTCLFELHRVMASTLDILKITVCYTENSTHVDVEFLIFCNYYT